MSSRASLIDAFFSFSVVIAIAILLPMAAYYGASLIHPEPSYYSSFEKERKLRVLRGEIRKNPVESENNKQLYVEIERIEAENKKHRETYQLKRKKYQQKMFYIQFPIGFLFILIGLLWRKNIINAGFILGGSLGIVSAYSSVWGSLTNLIKFVSLLGALLIILLLTYVKSCREKK